MAETEHVIAVLGDGHFSSATCTGCEWSSAGATPVELTDRWRIAHVNMDLVTDPDPNRRPIRIPAPSAREDIAAVERCIIGLVATWVDTRNVSYMNAAVGASMARSIMMGQELNDQPYLDYVLDLGAVTSHVPQRDRRKMRDASRSTQQSLLGKAEI